MLVFLGIFSIAGVAAGLALTAHAMGKGPFHSDKNRP